MALTWLARRLTNAGLRVAEVDGWRTAGRPGAFAPRGVLIHHTAGARSSANNPAPSLSTVINGRSDLAGPLCQVLVDYNGVCWVVAAGRTNNAGAAKVSGPLPATSDGNALYVGIEIDYRVNPDGTSTSTRVPCRNQRRSWLPPPSSPASGTAPATSADTRRPASPTRSIPSS